MKKYAVKDIFGPTIQGEGSLAGAVVAFLRFAGCNIWNGRPETKEKSGCPFCDTDFVGGDVLSADEIVGRLLALLPRGGGVVVSGGEPLLQLDEELASALVGAGFSLSVETNGTRQIGVRLGRYLSHVTCSPKTPRDGILLGATDDLKVLFPHPNPLITPEAFATFPATRRFLQPVNGDDTLDEANVAKCVARIVDLARSGEHWSLSLQIHKVIGVE